jgi:hypothetical protein
MACAPVLAGVRPGAQPRADTAAGPVLTAIALTLAGQAGARLAALLDLTAGRSSLLQLFMVCCPTPSPAGDSARSGRFRVPPPGLWHRD